MQIIAVCAGSAPRVHPALYLLLLLLTWGAGHPNPAPRSWPPSTSRHTILATEADSRGNLGRFGKQVVKEGNQ